MKMNEYTSRKFRYKYDMDHFLKRYDERIFLPAFILNGNYQEAVSIINRTTGSTSVASNFINIKYYISACRTEIINLCMHLIENAFFYKISEKSNVIGHNLDKMSLESYQTMPIQHLYSVLNKTSRYDDPIETRSLEKISLNITDIFFSEIEKYIVTSALEYCARVTKSVKEYVEEQEKEQRMNAVLSMFKDKETTVLTGEERYNMICKTILGKYMHE